MDLLTDWLMDLVTKKRVEYPKPAMTNAGYTATPVAFGWAGAVIEGIHISGTYSCELMKP